MYKTPARTKPPAQWNAAVLASTRAPFSTSRANPSMVPTSTPSAARRLSGTSTLGYQSNSAEAAHYQDHLYEPDNSRSRRRGRAYHFIDGRNPKCPKALDLDGLTQACVKNFDQC